MKSDKLVTASLTRILAGTGLEPPVSVADLLAMKLVTMAMDGDIRAISEILNRVEGKPEAVNREVGRDEQERFAFNEFRDCLETEAEEQRTLQAGL